MVRHGKGRSLPPPSSPVEKGASPGCSNHLGCVTSLLWVSVSAAVNRGTHSLDPMGKQKTECEEGLGKALALGTMWTGPAFESEAFALNMSGVFSFSFSHGGPGRPQAI